MNAARLALAISLTALAGCGGSAPTAPAQRTAAVPTASDQSRSDADLAVTTRIRQSLMADERLSTPARNVVIVTIDGQVTLRGHVPSMREKAEIGTRAREIAGIDRVDNRVEIADGR